MKKSLSRLLKFFVLSASLIVLVLLAGCVPQGGQATATPKPDNSPTKEMTATITTYPTANPVPTATPVPYLLVDEADLAGVTVQFWHPYTNQTADRLREMVQNFNTENEYGIQVEVFSMGAASALAERMAAQSEDGGELPDLVAAPIVLINQWNQDGWVIPVNDYLTHPVWGWDTSALETVDALSLEQTQLDAVQISMPLVRSTAVLYYNASWAQELGFNSPPTTLRALREQACAAQQSLLEDADRENDGTGGWIINFEESTLVSWLAAFGEETFLEPDGGYEFETSASQEAFNYLWQMNADGCAWTSREPLPYDYFATRRALLYSASSRDTLWQELAFSKSGSQDEWAVLPYPAESGAPILVWDVNALAILESSPEEQLAAWFFTEWLLGEKNQAILSISTNSLPVQETAWRWMEVALRNHPEWAALRTMNANNITTPQHPNWLLTGNILEDAAWQLFQPYTKAEDIPLILKQLDAMIFELSE